MKVITQQKPFEEIRQVLEKDQKIYLIGCGTCATMCQTGGKSEVLEMKEKLEKLGKEVTGWMVISTPCDNLTREALAEDAKAIEAAEALLVMSCAFGIQMVARYSDKAVYPALNTLFIGQEDTPAHFSEICVQCGNCVLGRTAGICPLTVCPKGLLNGPCGGYQDGMCEVDPNRECAWVQIYNRLKKLDQLEKLFELQSLKDYSKASHPRHASFSL